MATTNLGKILIINRGSWDASASYQPLDVVSMNNSTALYLCKVANTGVDPSTDPTKWDLWIDVNNVDAYTKAETDEKLAEKADVDDIPTKTSELENDSGFLTEHQSLEEYAKKSELPTKTSDLTNDSGFITNEYHDSTKLDASLKGVANGVASLDAGGKVPTDQLPSFVDDVVEGYFYNEVFYSDIEHTQVITGEANKIYVDLHTNNSYRWSGSAYILISIANVYTKEETNLRLNEKVTKEIVSSDGKAIIFNESDGGGAKFENVDNTWSFVGVNNGGADGLAAQVYAVDSTDNYKGSKLDVTTSGIYYTTGDDSVSPASDRDVAANEIATMGDIPSLANYYTKTETDEKILWEKGTGEGSVQVKGSNSSAESDYSVAEGLNTKTLVSEEETQGRGSHAEGIGSIAKASASHAEGNTTMTLGSYSHAEGSGTTTGGAASHAEGNGTVTNNFAEHAEGSHNVSNKASDNFGDEGNTISSVGIGTSLEDKKNALEIMQNGDAYLYGVGDYDGTNINDADTLQEVLANIGSDVMVVNIEKDYEKEMEDPFFAIIADKTYAEIKSYLDNGGQVISRYMSDFFIPLLTYGEDVIQFGSAVFTSAPIYFTLVIYSDDEEQDIGVNMPMQMSPIAGDAIDITDDTIAVKYDNSTIKLNSDGELEAEIPTITASTVDLEDGVSPLATGTLYLVYEE